MVYDDAGRVGGGGGNYNKFEKNNKIVINTKPKEVILHTNNIDSTPTYIKIKQKKYSNHAKT